MLHHPKEGEWRYDHNESLQDFTQYKVHNKSLY